MKNILKATLALLFTLCTFSCHFSASDDLIEYLDNGGLRTPTVDPTEYSQLRPVEAEEKEAGGSAWASLKDGAIYETDRTIRLLPPSLTVKGLEVTGNPKIVYRLWRFSRTAKMYSLIATDDSAKAELEGIEVSTDIIDGGLTLSAGKYYLEARADLIGFIDSNSAIWNFSIGWDETVSISIELPDNYRCYYVLGMTSFSRSHMDEYNTITVTPQVYRITGTDSSGKEIKELVDTPADLPAPTIWLETMEGDTIIEAARGYSMVLTADLPAETYRFRVQVEYAGITNDGTQEILITE